MSEVTITRYAKPAQWPKDHRTPQQREADQDHLKALAAEMERKWLKDFEMRQLAAVTSCRCTFLTWDQMPRGEQIGFLAGRVLPGNKETEAVLSALRITYEAGRADRAPEPGAAGHVLTLDWDPFDGEQVRATCECNWVGPWRPEGGETAAQEDYRKHRERAEARAEQPPAGDAAGLAFKLGDFLGRWKRLPDEPNRTQLSYALEREALSWLRRNGAVIADVLAAYRDAPREEPQHRQDAWDLIANYESAVRAECFDNDSSRVKPALDALLVALGAGSAAPQPAPEPIGVIAACEAMGGGLPPLITTSDGTAAPREAPPATDAANLAELNEAWEAWSMCHPKRTTYRLLEALVGVAREAGRGAP